MCSNQGPPPFGGVGPKGRSREPCAYQFASVVIDAGVGGWVEGGEEAGARAGTHHDGPDHVGLVSGQRGPVEALAARVDLHTHARMHACTHSLRQAGVLTVRLGAEPP